VYILTISSTSISQAIVPQYDSDFVKTFKNASIILKMVVLPLEGVEINDFLILQVSKAMGMNF
jgi:hypothetical protein